MRRAKPALTDRRVRIKRALEYNLLPVWFEDAEDQEQIGIAGRRSDKQLCHQRTSDLCLLLERQRVKRDAITQRLVVEPRRVSDRLIVPC